MNSEIWPKSANTTAKLLIFRTQENRLFEAMAGLAGLALIRIRTPVHMVPKVF